jgi:hypothetical protein
LQAGFARGDIRNVVGNGNADGVAAGGRAAHANRRNGIGDGEDLQPFATVSFISKTILHGHGFGHAVGPIRLAHKKRRSGVGDVKNFQAAAAGVGVVASHGQMARPTNCRGADQHWHRWIRQRKN